MTCDEELHGQDPQSGDGFLSSEVLRLYNPPLRGIKGGSNDLLLKQDSSGQLPSPIFTWKRDDFLKFGFVEEKYRTMTMFNY